MSTKLLVWITAGIFALGLVAAVALYPRCEKPSDMQVRITILQCVVEAINDQASWTDAKLCTVLGKEADCKLSAQDLPAIRAYIDKTVGDCAKGKLAAENMCIDTVDQFIKGAE